MSLPNNSFGYLEYDPRNNVSKFKEWWLILKCDINIYHLYRTLIKKDASKIISGNIFGFGELDVAVRGISITRPIWGPHISVVRGENPQNKNMWNKFNSRRISFEYDGNVKTNGSHYWLQVYSNDLLDIREQLGLRREPKVPLHLTLGYDQDSKL